MKKARSMPSSQVQYRARHARWTAAGPFLLLTLLVLAAFGPTLTHDFVWDDYGLIVQNPAIHVEKGWIRLLCRSFWQTGANVADVTRSFYRPLVSISYNLDHVLWGRNPMGYHLTNVALHAVATWLIYAFGLRLLRVRATALLAAALFAVHPSHIENVAWISGRTDIVAAIFMLGALLALPPPGSTRCIGAGRIIAVCACCLLALLGKEMALSSPLILVAYITTQFPATTARWRRYMPLLGGVVGVTAGYLLLRIVVLGRIVGPGVFGTPWQRVAAIPAVLARYLGVMAHWIAIDPHHPATYEALTAPGAILVGTLVTAAYAALLWMLWRRNDRTVVFLLAWFPITLLPVLKLGVFGDVLYADRFLYLPSIGLLAGVIALWNRARLLRRLAWTRTILAPALVVLFMVGSIALLTLHIPYWKTNRTLFEHAVYTSPHSAYIQYNVANSRSMDGDYADAIPAYLRAVRLEPDYSQAFANMGIALAREGRYGEATSCLQKAIAQGDRSVITYTNLGNVYRALGALEQARTAYRASLAIAETAAARNNLGETLLPDQPEAAYGHFARAHETAAGARTLNNLALALIELRKPEEAIPYLDMARNAHKGLPDELTFAIAYNLARAWRNAGQQEAAQPYAAQAKQLWQMGLAPTAAHATLPAELVAILNSENTPHATYPHHAEGQRAFAPE